MAHDYFAKFPHAIIGLAYAASLWQTQIDG